MAQVPYQEDADHRGPDYGHPSFLQRLRALTEPFKKKLGLLLSVGVQWIPAPSSNFTVGRGGYSVTGVIIHTTVGTMEATDGTFQNPSRNASAHYAVAYDGAVIHQYVQESDTAWHCGRYYPDADNPLSNLNTIGIEHVDNGFFNSPRPDGLYETSAQLVREICVRYGIPIDRTHIKKHNEVSVLGTGCPDSLDIDRIVAMAHSGIVITPNPNPKSRSTTVATKNTINLFVMGTDSALWQNRFDTSWAGWKSLGGVLTNPDITATVRGDQIDVFVAGTGGAIFHIWSLDLGKTWSQYEALGGVTSGSITAIATVPDPTPDILAAIAAIPAGPKGLDGKDSVVPGPRGADSTVPGPKGDPGVVPDHHHVVPGATTSTMVP